MGSERVLALIVLIVLANILSVLGNDYSRLVSTFLALLGILVLPLVGSFFAGRSYGFKGTLLSLGASFLTLLGVFLGIVVGSYRFECSASAGLVGCLALGLATLATLFIVIPASVALFFFIGSVAGALFRRRALKRGGEKAGGDLYEF